MYEHELFELFYSDGGGDSNEIGGFAVFRWLPNRLSMESRFDPELFVCMDGVENVGWDRVTLWFVDTGVDGLVKESPFDLSSGEDDGFDGENKDRKLKTNKYHNNWTNEYKSIVMPKGLFNKVRDYENGGC